MGRATEAFSLLNNPKTKQFQLGHIDRKSAIKEIRAVLKKRSKKRSGLICPKCKKIYQVDISISESAKAKCKCGQTGLNKVSIKNGKLTTQCSRSRNVARYKPKRCQPNPDTRNRC